MKSLLGLLAIGGAVAYAQKRRGGELSIAGFKNSLRDLMNNVRGQLGNQTQQRQQHVGMGGTRPMSRDEDLGGVGSVGSRVGASSNIGGSDVAGVGSTGGTQSGLGGDDISSGYTGYGGSSDTNRKY